MKKILLLSSLLLVFSLTTGVASARVHFGFALPLPPVVIAPPVVAAPPAYYPNPYGYYFYPYPYGYYSYPYGYYGPRVWGPRYWGYGGWGRARIPGHWRYRR